MRREYAMLTFAAVLIVLVGVGAIISNHSKSDTLKELSELEPFPELVLPVEGATEAEWQTFKTQFMAAFDLSEEDADSYIEEIKTEWVIKEKAKARESTLGTWEEALASGNLIKQRAYDDRIVKYYDVTDDHLPDFEIVFDKDDKPYLWRFLDEGGNSYG